MHRLLHPFRAAGCLGLCAWVLTLGAASAARAQCLSAVEIQKLIASDPNNGDEFGYSVAIVGDTLVVGAPKDDAGATNRGAVYIFTRSGDTWTQVQKLQSFQNALPDNNFGRCVAFDGDTILVGARGTSNSRGAAYIYTNSGGGGAWVETQMLVPADDDDGDQFGASVALTSIGTRKVAVVGAPGDDNTGPTGTTGGTDAGAVYVFTRNTITINDFAEVEKIMATDGASFDGFGSSHSVRGGTAVIGAPSDDNVSGTNAGAAYVFIGSATGGTWTQQTKLTPPSGANQFFGKAIAYQSNTAAIIAEGISVFQGRLHIFTSAASVWTLLQTFNFDTSDPVPGSFERGVSVSLDGDYLVASAKGDPSDGVTRIPRLFTREGGPGGMWVYATALPPLTIGSFANRGSAVAISGDTVVVGAVNDNAPTANAGSAYVVDLVPIDSVSITQQPVDDATCLYGTAQFSVMGTGGGTITYQWQSESAPNVWGNLLNVPTFGNVSGALTPTVTITNVQPSAATRFRCVVENPCSLSVSEPVTLSICAADFNCSGGGGGAGSGVTADDIFAFLDAWFAQNGQSGGFLTADFNASGSVTADDIFAFLDAWFAQNGVCGV